MPEHRGARTNAEPRRSKRKASGVRIGSRIATRYVSAVRGFISRKPSKTLAHTCTFEMLQAGRTGMCAPRWSHWPISHRVPYYLFSRTKACGGWPRDTLLR